jgi:para-nitrobenzyl esterase
MKKLYFLLLGCVAMNTMSSRAQCPAGRFDTELFPTVNISTVTYSTPYNLQMDIYQPAGDTMAHRPVIILAHGGSFFAGTRTDDATVDTLCMRFARRGYVTASIDYRLTTIGVMLTAADSLQQIDAVMKAVSDGKAAVRYFVQDAATTNTYKVDSNSIFVGGNSAGAVLYMHVVYLDSIQECPANIATAMAANGDFEGNSGNAGYTTKTKAMVNLAGALNQTSFVGPNEKPSVNFQGSQDNVVPYTCGYPLGGACHLQLCGLGALEPVYTAQGTVHMSKVFPGDAHVPWDSDAAKFKSVDSLTTIFLYSQVCGSISNVNVINANVGVNIYPSPASDFLTISADQSIDHIIMYDAMGRTAAQVTNVKGTEHTLNTARLPAGTYLLHITFANRDYSPVVKRIVIE